MWIGDEEDIRKLLGKWRGSNAQVWEYTVGHGTLLVRLFRPNERAGLFVQCKDCRTIRFPSMGWKNADLSLRQKESPQQNDEDFRFELEDGERFFTACWAVYLLESDKPVFIDYPIESRKPSENYILI
jgi:hypothetical protein